MLFLIKEIYDSVYDTLELNKSEFKSKILVDKYIYLSLSWDITVPTLQEKIQYANGLNRHRRHFLCLYLHLP